MIFLSMLLLGTLIGFVGAGGAGVTITLLTVGFNSYSYSIRCCLIFYGFYYDIWCYKPST